MKLRDHKRTRITERFERIKGENHRVELAGERFTSPTQLITRVQQGKGHLVVALNTAFKAQLATDPVS